jgi:flagellar basal-body rod modification protein FlgD
MTATIGEISSFINAESSPIKELRSSTLGKEDFLRLLVTQLTHQDPLNPEDPTEFTAQLAQFSSLEQLFNVNETLEKVNASNAELERLSALSMLGHEVVSASSSFHLETGGMVKLGYQLTEPAESVKIYARDNLNRTVASFSANQVETGEHWLIWDGLDANGQVAPPGDYRLVVSAVNNEEEPLDISPLISGIVTGIEVKEDTNILNTNSGDFNVNTIRNIKHI